MLEVGFTGSRLGMVEYQKILFQTVMVMIKCKEDFSFHHGDCLGADAQAHTIAAEVGAMEIHIHPPENPTLRAFCDRFYPEIVHSHEPKPYAERNKDIVRACSILLATPRTMQEVKRSGTWSTVRFARKQKVATLIVPPYHTPIMELERQILLALNKILYRRV